MATKKEQPPDYQELAKERILKLICDEKSTVQDLEILVHSFSSKYIGNTLSIKINIVPTYNYYKYLILRFYKKYLLKIFYKRLYLLKFYIFYLKFNKKYKILIKKKNKKFKKSIYAKKKS